MYKATPNTTPPGRVREGQQKTKYPGLAENEYMANTRRMDAWVSQYFHQFIAAMVKCGYTHDEGASYGPYSIPFYAKDKVQWIALCYPGADWDLNCVSKIVIKSTTPGLVRQSVFYFEDERSFRLSLRDAVKYSKECQKLGGDSRLLS